LIHPRGNDGGFRQFPARLNETGGIEFLGAEAVAGDVDDVLDSARRCAI